ncbi:MAG TPA: hypothetical protein PK043_15425, partial [Alicycliphilus sp.]|nr:hypothetical protein [Alicycliphilus sp.]
LAPQATTGARHDGHAALEVEGHGNHLQRKEKYKNQSTLRFLHKRWRPFLLTFPRICTIRAAWPGRVMTCR